ncbi:NADH-quinone oxidoreductase subunit J [Wenzhouxiangella marina]|uniref:NADH-quinone oxidoreductase subunit J n=1 Tax=Wenzhouxiangella marina TaxID=1579979 RepID=A0A0K0XTP1_9GAMM|nr:NADH-quinone oxidoreductase subunit J [Wenzhouxiangella marina]AKS40991.1 NADH:ubiquinone oxidoreductase subunit J [Wenzhouxiangella marina]MBB6087865.1 NADH-quinone oxidoreductase subunit J [Wenzhouxiangella marina]
MPIVEIAFYLFGAVLIGSALSVVTVGNPIYAVLFLVLSFFSAACIWMLLQAEFLSIVLVLVYVGAVMVLFLFVVMMLDVNVNPVREGFARYLPVGLLVALAMAAQMFMVIWTRGLENQLMPEPRPQGYSHTREVGEMLYTNYLFAFEIAAVLLLVAIVAAIALTHRRRPETKHQDPSQQVRIKREERVRLIKMASEGEEG